MTTGKGFNREGDWSKGHPKNGMSVPGERPYTKKVNKLISLLISVTLIIILAGCAGQGVDPIVPAILPGELQSVANAYLGSLALGDLEGARRFLHPSSPLQESIHIIAAQLFPFLYDLHSMGCHLTVGVSLSTAWREGDFAKGRIQEVIVCTYCGPPDFFAECAEDVEMRGEVITYLQHEGKWRIY